MTYSCITYYLVGREQQPGVVSPRPAVLEDRHQLKRSEPGVRDVLESRLHPFERAPEAGIRDLASAFPSTKHIVIVIFVDVMTDNKTREESGKP